MILTDEEAKTKRCQESFGDGFVADSPMMMGTGGRAVSISSPSHCIGSACMAWRWGGYRARSGDVYFDPQFNGTGDSDAPRVGYCGKAGKP